MAGYGLHGTDAAVSLNKEHTIGVTTPDRITTNQTRTTLFEPELLSEWADAVAEAYNDPVRVVFTPDRPIIATAGESAVVGIGLAPRVLPDEMDGGLDD